LCGGVGWSVKGTPCATSIANGPLGAMFYPFSSPSLFLFPEAERRRGRRKGVEGGGIRPPPSNPLYAPLPAPRSGGGRVQGLTSVGFSPGRGAGCRFWALTLPPAPSLSRLREREGEKKGILRWRLLATTAKSQSNSPSPGQRPRGEGGYRG
jgi:hypothetical protein